MVYTLSGICMPSISGADGSSSRIEKAQPVEAVVDLPYGLVTAIFQSRQFDWIGLGRGPIHFARDGSIQCFVRTLPVEFMSEPIEAALLRGEVCLQRINGGRLQTAVHALMAPVLPRPAGADALRTNTEPDPPLGQRADATHRQRGKRRSIVGTDV